MKKIVLFTLLLISSLFASKYSSYEAKNHIGEEGTVCGKVVSTYYASSSNGKPTFLNIDKPYPNQVFTAVIWGKSRHNFSTPERQYKNKNVCISGYIDSYRGVPQINVSSTSQINNY